MNDDNLSGIFEHLNPEDFAGSDFDLFVSAEIVRQRQDVVARDGYIRTSATLVAGSIREYIQPDGPEPMGHYVARITGRSREIGASWVFLAFKTQIGVVLDTKERAEAMKVDDPEAMAVAESMGSTQPAVYWYAEHRGTDQKIERQHGFLTLVGNRLGPSTKYEIPQQVGLFGDLLG